MWRSRCFRRNLRQLFDSRSRRPWSGGGGSTDPTSLGLARASSVAAPFSELGTRGFSHSVGGAVPRRPHYDSFDPIFIRRKVEEDVVGADGLGTKASESDDDLVPPLEGSAESIAQCSLEVCSNQTLRLKTRLQAIKAISRLAKDKPDSLENHGLAKRILQVMFRLLAEGDKAYDSSPTSVAAREVIETMALNLPERVFSPALEFAWVSSLSTKPKYREAALVALGAIAEGCSQLIRGKLETPLDIVLEAHRGKDPMVRAAAEYALRRFAEHLQPEILSRRDTVIPCILDAITGQDDDYDMDKCDSYGSLKALCSNMAGDDILLFLFPIMRKLLSGLRSEGLLVPMGSMDAMCSVAAAAGQGFLPYAERVMESIKPFERISQTGAFVAAGVVATTVGKEATGPLLATCIEDAILSFPATADEWDQRYPCRHRRHTYGFFCAAVETLGDGFAKYLPGVVPLALSSCNLDEAPTRGGLFRTSISRTEALDEKAAATQALGLFAVHTKNVLTAAQAVFKNRSDGAADAKEVLGTVMNIYTKAMVEDRDRRVVAQVCTNTVDILKDFEYAAWEPHMPQIFDSASQLLEKQSACQQHDNDGSDSEHDETVTAAVTNLIQALDEAKAAGRSTTSDHSGC